MMTTQKRKSQLLYSLTTILLVSTMLVSVLSLLPVNFLPQVGADGTLGCYIGSPDLYGSHVSTSPYQYWTYSFQTLSGTISLTSMTIWLGGGGQVINAAVYTNAYINGYDQPYNPVSGTTIGQHTDNGGPEYLNVAISAALSPNTKYWIVVLQGGVSGDLHNESTNQCSPEQSLSYQASSNPHWTSFPINGLAGYSWVSHSYAMLFSVAYTGTLGTGTSTTASTSTTPTSTQTGSGNVPTDNLQLWYKFNEGTGTSTADSSQNQNSGTLVNGVSWVSGKFSYGTSYTSSSSKYVRSVSNSPIGLQMYHSSYSVCGWFKTTIPDTASLTIPTLVAYGNPTQGSTGEYKLYFQPFGPGYWFLKFGNVDAGTYLSSVNEDGYLNNGNWHHTCGVFDYSQGHGWLYIDGQLNTDGPMGNTGTSTGPLTIGAEGADPASNTFTRYLDLTTVDEIMIYSRALSSADVAAVYTYNGSPIVITTTTTGTTSIITSTTSLTSSTITSTVSTGTSSSVSLTPELWWKFNEGSGIIAQDSTSNNYDGTLTNGVTWVSGYVSPYATEYASGSSQFTVVANPANLIMSGSYSICAWVKTTSTPSTTVIIAEWKNPDGYYYQLIMQGSGGGNPYHAEFRDKNNGVVYTTSAINDGSWHDICGVLNLGTNTRYIYVDTSSASASESGNVGGSNPSSFTVGCSTGGTSTCVSAKLDGDVEDVRVYAGALSSGDVSAIYTYRESLVTTTISTGSTVVTTTIATSSTVTSSISTTTYPITTTTPTVSITSTRTTTPITYYTGSLTTTTLPITLTKMFSSTTSLVASYVSTTTNFSTVYSQGPLLLSPIFWNNFLYVGLFLVLTPLAFLFLTDSVLGFTVGEIMFAIAGWVFKFIDWPIMVADIFVSVVVLITFRQSMNAEGSAKNV